MYTVCMKGNIYTDRKCHCGGSFQHIDRKGALFCRKCEARYSGSSFIVRFGRDISERCRSYDHAAQFLTGLRHETAKGSFDKRDYKSDNPLSFAKQIDKWLDIKRGEVSQSQYMSCKRYIEAALDFIGDKNVKHIRYANIEDFLTSSLAKKRWSDKTRSNVRSVIHDFFVWLEAREDIPVPKMPHIKFELGYRTITDIETRQQILDEVWRIAPSKVAFGVELLATYPALRPGDLLRVTEADLRGDVLTIIDPTKQRDKPKLVRLLEHHADHWRDLMLSIPVINGSPLMFRHQQTRKGCRKDQPYGKRYFYKWWIKACDNLGIKGLDLYGGTRHTTTTALADLADPASAKMASGHQTNKAFDRYCQAADKTAFKMAKLISPVQHLYNINGGKKARN